MNIKISTTALIIAFCCCFNVQAGLIPLYDQSFDLTFSELKKNDTRETEFHVLNDISLSGLCVLMDVQAETIDIRWRLREGKNNSTGKMLVDRTVQHPGIGSALYDIPVDLILHAGMNYTLQIKNTDQDFVAHIGWVPDSTSNPTPDGYLMDINGYDNNNDGFQLAAYSLLAIPEPASIAALFGLGLTLARLQQRRPPIPCNN
jgi:hypothetical protein